MPLPPGSSNRRVEDLEDDALNVQIRDGLVVDQGTRNNADITTGTDDDTGGGLNQRVRGTLPIIRRRRSWISIYTMQL